MEKWRNEEKNGVPNSHRMFYIGAGPTVLPIGKKSIQQTASSFEPNDTVRGKRQVASSSEDIF